MTVAECDACGVVGPVRRVQGADGYDDMLCAFCFAQRIVEMSEQRLCEHLQRSGGCNCGD
jgi:hypothetical protein